MLSVALPTVATASRERCRQLTFTRTGAPAAGVTVSVPATAPSENRHVPLPDTVASVTNRTFFRVKRSGVPSLTVKVPPRRPGPVATPE